MSGPTIKEQRLALLRQRDRINESLNAIAYPNTLPIEVLSYIFALHSAMVMQVQGASQKRRSAERIRIAHVCRHWRAVAVESAELWSNLLFTSARIVRLMVTRSKTAPLTVAMRQVDTRLNAPLLDIISSQTHRLRSVQITNISDLKVVSLLAVPMPLLEKLVLEFSNQSCGQNTRTLPGLLDHLLYGNPPELKHLEIVDFDIPNFKTLPLVPSLTHLHLGSTKSLPMLKKPSARDLLSSLQQLPHLETLVLAHYVPSDAYPSRASCNPIELPSLQSISISGPIDSLRNLLGAIRIPNASLAVVLTDPVEHIETVQAFLLTIAQAREVTNKQPPLQSLMIKTPWPEHNCIVFHFRFNDSVPGPKPCTCISIGFTKPVLLLHPRYLLDEFAASFGLVNWVALKSLHVAAHWMIGRDEWEVFGRFPGLKSIAFSCNADVKAFIKLLNEGSTLGSTGSEKPQACDLPLFPALSSLSIEGVELLEESEYRDILVSALNKRTGPHRIKKLNVTFDDEGFSQEDVDFLQTSVPGLKVKWEQDDEVPELDTDDEWDSEEAEGEE